MLPMDSPVVSIGPSDSGRVDAENAAIVARLKYCVEKISLGFDRWTDPHAHGPGLYFVVARESATAFAEPMGANRWPVEDCGNVFAPLDTLVETTKHVAFRCDGAVIVHTDGEIEEQMMRITQLVTADREQSDGLPYAGWMGARHMSALETSTRPEVLAAITLSEEDGRLTIFIDGMYADYPRDALGDER